MKHGFLLVDKPAGISSHDVVYQVRRALHEKKVGHLGTLDPAATGLMVLAVGAKALKVVELFGNLGKEYIATVELGKTSSTYDREGSIEDFDIKPGVQEPDLMAVRTLIDDHFVGTIDQVPPMHSAVHVGGERAYRKARQGQQVDMPTRSVTIEECSILDYAYPEIVLSVACSSGTYIRSFAHDIGQKLRCGGYLKDLRRTKVGEWSVDFSVPPDAIGWSHVIPLKEVLVSQQGIDVSDAEAEDLKHGRNISKQVKVDTIAWHGELPIAILTPAKDGTQMAHARKVF